MRASAVIARLSRQSAVCRPVARIAALSTVSIPRTRTLALRRDVAAITRNHSTAASRQDVMERA